MTITIFICYAAKSAKKSGRSIELQKKNKSTLLVLNETLFICQTVWGRDSHLFPIPDWMSGSLRGKLCLTSYIFTPLMGVVRGWIDDTFAYAKRFNGHDFSRYYLVVIVTGDTPMKSRSGEDRRSGQEWRCNWRVKPGA